MSRPTSVLTIGLVMATVGVLAIAGCSADTGAAADPTTAATTAAEPPAAEPLAAEPMPAPSDATSDARQMAGLAETAAAAQLAARPEAAAAAVQLAALPETASTDRNLITAQGIGKVSGTPDIVTIGLGVETSSPSAQTALDDNNRLATEAIDVLKANGIAPEDLQTSQLSVYPSYNDQAQITGYQVTNMVTAKLRNIGTAGAVIDAVGRSAGNAIRVQQLSFSIEDDSALRATARADAVKRAQVQAQQLADAAGVALGPVHAITETPAQSRVSYPAVAMDTAGAAAAESVPIESGSLELNVTVQVAYEIAQ